MNQDNVILAAMLAFCILITAMTFQSLNEFNKLDLPAIIKTLPGGK